MGRLIVDENKCKRDGICAGECPMAIIKLKDGDGFPKTKYYRLPQRKTPKNTWK